MSPRHPLRKDNGYEFTRKKSAVRRRHTGARGARRAGGLRRVADVRRRAGSVAGTGAAHRPSWLRRTAHARWASGETLLYRRRLCPSAQRRGDGINAAGHEGRGDQRRRRRAGPATSPSSRENAPGTRIAAQSAGTRPRATPPRPQGPRRKSWPVGPMIDRLRIVQGDITKQVVDAIVNAANSTLLGGGGVDGAIHRAAGRELLEECKTLNGCPTGEARITKGYKLPATWVIHTVGPIWRGGGHNEDELLASCYRSCFARVEQHGIRSVAFPSISTGAYSFPLERACRIALSEIQIFLNKNS